MVQEKKKKLRIAVWHNLPSGGGKRQLYIHIKGLVERGHVVEAWCPPTADQTFLPLSTIIQEHIVPLRIKGFFHKRFYSYMLRPARTVRALCSALEQHSQQVADAMKRKGFDVLFVNACQFFKTSCIATYVSVPSVLYIGEPNRVLYEALPTLAWVAPRTRSTLSLAIREIKRIFYLWNTPRIVSAQFLDSSLAMREIKRTIGRNFFHNGLRVQAKLESLYAEKYDRLLVNSLYSRECILRTYGLESHVCYLGVDTEYYRPTGEAKENFVVGLGTLYYGKGVDRALYALATIKREKRPPLLWIGNAASNTDLAEYQKLADRLGVEFIPKINISDHEVISMLSRACALLYTSRLEPFGLAVLEANACGTPVVGIAEGGVRESVAHGVNGFLAQENDPILLGSLVERFIDDPILASEMGTKAREQVQKNWNMKFCIDNIEKHLLSLVA